MEDTFQSKYYYSRSHSSASIADRFKFSSKEPLNHISELERPATQRSQSSPGFIERLKLKSKTSFSDLSSLQRSTLQFTKSNLSITKQKQQTTSRPKIDRTPSLESTVSSTDSTSSIESCKSVKVFRQEHCDLINSTDFDDAILYGFKGCANKVHPPNHIKTIKTSLSPSLVCTEVFIPEFMMYYRDESQTEKEYFIY